MNHTLNKKAPIPGGRATVVTALFAAMLLTACGGGGGGGDSGGGPGPVINPPPTRTPQTVIFVASDGVATNGQTELYAIEDDGTGLRRLSTDAVANDTAIKDFALSPDGLHVAYTSNTRGALFLPELIVVPPAGGTAQQVSRVVGSGSNQGVDSFQWAPNNAQLVYAGNLDNLSANEVYVVNRDGGPSTRINGAIGSGPSVEVRNPQWSPDGSSIVQEVARFQSGQPSVNAFALNTFDATASALNSTRLVDANSTVRNVRWSPDGQRLSYTSDQFVTNDFRLFTIDADGTGNTLLTNVDDFNGEGRWSPDSARVAYLDGLAGSLAGDLIVSEGRAGAIDTVLVSATPNGRQVYDFAWSPDGRSIAFIANLDEPNVRELYRIPSDGSGSPTKISGPMPDRGDVLSFAFAPNGGSIAYTADADTDTFVDLYTIDGNGGVSRVSTGLNGEEVTGFDWSRFSDRIAFSTGPAGRTPTATTLYSSNPDGSDRVRLTDATFTGPVDFSY